MDPIEDKWISRKLDLAIKLFVCLFLLAFSVGAVLEFQAGGLSSFGAWAFSAMALACALSLMTANKALRGAVVLFLAFFSA